jgi:hypothetical protein
VVRGAVGAVAAPVLDVPDAAVEPTAPRSPRRRALVVGIAVAASAVLVAAIGAAAVLGGAIGGPEGADPVSTGTPSEDAVVAARVPVPEVGAGVPAADGTVVFPVSHDGAEEGDRYRWQRADGSGSTAVASGPEIVVDGVPAGATVCIDVQVQRGSKTSEPVTGCTP